HERVARGHLRHTLVGAGGHVASPSPAFDVPFTFDGSWIIWSSFLPSTHRGERLIDLAIGEVGVGQPEVRGRITGKLRDRPFVMDGGLAPSLQAGQRAGRVVVGLETVDPVAKQ